MTLSEKQAEKFDARIKQIKKTLNNEMKELKEASEKVELGDSLNTSLDLIEIAVDGIRQNEAVLFELKRIKAKFQESDIYSFETALMEIDGLSEGANAALNSILSEIEEL